MQRFKCVRPYRHPGIGAGLCAALFRCSRSGQRMRARPIARYVKRVVRM